MAASGVPLPHQPRVLMLLPSQHGHDHVLVPQLHLYHSVEHQTLHMIDTGMSKQDDEVRTRGRRQGQGEQANQIWGQIRALVVRELYIGVIRIKRNGYLI